MVVVTVMVVVVAAFVVQVALMAATDEVIVVTDVVVDVIADAEVPLMAVDWGVRGLSCCCCCCCCVAAADNGLSEGGMPTAESVCLRNATTLSLNLLLLIGSW